MSAFQPILTCFLCLVFANIAVKGMAIVTSRRFMCSGEAISSKSYMTNLLDEWRKQKKESTRLNINQSQVRQHLVFVLILFLFFLLFYSKKIGSNQIFIVLAVLR